MPPAPPTDSGAHRVYSKKAGLEPLPGYKLLAPLGHGGFGEVWKCEAPGGLHKAIKFVPSEADDGRGQERFGQELAAFEEIKAIRHPFLLTLERVEEIAGELVMVMELADRQLQDRFRECRTCGLPGIPRDELLAYFADAAEALDMIAGKFGLQHLDIKPANLFLVSGHVKVGDYGLVSKLGGDDAGNRGLTPRYVAPEVLHGTPSACSDQYSLALVYAELLTGEFPYVGRTPQQMMLQHVSGKPNLAALPPADQPAIGRALEKKPENRFPSCLAFVQALMMGGADTALPNAAMNLRRARVDRSVAEMNLAAGHDPEPHYDPGHSTSAPGITGHTQSFTLPSRNPLTQPGQGRGALPPLVAAPRGAPGAKTGGRYPANPIVTPAPMSAETPPPMAEECNERVVIDAVRSVVPVAALIGMASSGSAIDPQSFAVAALDAAAGGGLVPHMPGEVGRLKDGTWVVQFPSTVPATVVPLKLAVLRDKWGVGIEQPDAAHLVLRRTTGGGGFFGGKKFGLEVTVLLPTAGKSVGEVTVLGRTFGAPDPKSAREALDHLPKILADVRAQLGNVQDRRRNPRVSCGLALSLYPVHSDGGIDDAIPARCRDVSLGGIGFSVAHALQTKYVYAVFPNVAATAGSAILLRLVRVQSVGTERQYGAQYRCDL
jgi:eukaryotic-like serine/threonine-protein kinase